MNNKHMILMILGCGLPILAILLLPFFGFSENYIYLLALGLMFGLHFLMMGSHNHGGSHDHDQHSDYGQDRHINHDSNRETKGFDSSITEYDNVNNPNHTYSHKVERRT